MASGRFPHSKGTDERLVGRQRQLRRIREFVAASTGQETGHRRLLIIGEPGIGKTRLWTEGVAYADELGHRVLRTQADEAESGLAYAVAMELFDSVLDDVADDLSPMQHDALEAAFLRRPTSTPASALAVGVGVLALLRALAARGPVVIGLDDAQWIDPESALALGYALRRLGAEPIAVLGTARAAVPEVGLSPVDGDAAASLFAGGDEIRLGAVSTAQLHAIVRDATGVDPGARAVRRLHAGVGGNPFWAIEVVRSGELAANQPVSPPPSTVAVLNSRLADLSDDARVALAVVAAIGHAEIDTTMHVLADLGRNARGAIDAAYTQGVVVEREARLITGHPLLATAVLAGLSPPARRELHARIAARVTDPERHAKHAERAAPPGPDAQLATALERAARTSNRRAAPYAAASFWQRAIERTEPTSPEFLRRAVSLAVEYHQLGELPAVVELLTSRDRDGNEVIRPELFDQPIDVVDVALPVVCDSLVIVRGGPGARDTMHRSAQPLPDDDVGRVLLMAELAASNARSLLELEELAARSVELLESDGPRGTVLHRAMSTLTEVRLNLGRGFDTDLLARQEELEHHIRAPGTMESADASRALWSRIIDDVDGARAALERCRRRAVESGEVVNSAIFALHRAAVEVVAGDFVEARTHLPDIDDPLWTGTPPPFMLATTGAILLAEARYADLDRLLADSRHWTAGSDGFRELYQDVLSGLLSLRRDDAAGAVECFAAMRQGIGRLDLREPERWLRTDADHAAALVATGDLDGARELGERLEDFGRRANRTSALAGAARIRGLVAAASGDLDASLHEHETGLALAERTPLRLDVAKAHLDIARVLRRKRAREGARRHADEAIALFRQGGEQSLLQDALTERTRDERRPPGNGVDDHDGDEPGPRDPRLTPSESRVAVLAADGSTNRQIAAALFVSRRTVDSQLAAVYRKLGIRSRRELGDALEVTIE